MYRIALESKGKIQYGEEGEIEWRHEDLNRGRLRISGSIQQMEVGDLATVKIYGPSDSTIVLEGRISLIRFLGSGKEVPSYEIEIAPPEDYLNNTYIKLAEDNLSDKEWIEKILGPYKDEYPPLYYADFDDKFPWGMETYQSRFDLLREYCKTRKINFYFRKDGRPVFYDGTISVLPHSIDVITELEKVEDVTAAFNSMKFSAAVYVAEDEDLTESLPFTDYCWQGNCGWSYYEKELDSEFKVKGNYSVKIKDICFPYYYDHGPVYFYIRFSLPQDISWEDFMWFGCSIAFSQWNGRGWGMWIHPKIVLLDPNGNIPCIDDVKALKERKVAYWQTKYFLNENQNTGWISLRIPKDAFTGKVSTIRYVEFFFAEISGQEYSDQATFRTTIWIDDMWLVAEKNYEISIPESIEKYGVRECEPQRFTSAFYHEDQILNAASIFLSWISSPEESLRKVVSTIHYLQRGSVYKILNENWKVLELKHIVRDGMWYTDILCSKSPGKEPKRTERDLFRDIYFKLHGVKPEEMTSFFPLDFQFFKKIDVSAGIRARNILIEDVGKITNLQGSIITVGTIQNVKRIDAEEIYIDQVGSIHLFQSDITNIGTIEHADEINATKMYIGSIGSLNELIAGVANIDKIENVDTISHVGIMNVDEIQSVGKISDAGIIITGSLQADTITDVNFLSAGIANIENIENIDYLNVVGNAEIATIQNVQKGYFIDTSISHLTQVDTAYIVDATIYSGTINAVTIATATIDLALFKEATISQVDIEAGNISNVIFNACTINDVTISVATISQLEITNNLIGEGIIKAEHIDELAIKFEKLDLGIQKVLGSTLWEAEDLNVGNGGYVIDDSSASNGKAVQCTIKTDPDYFVYGPYKTLPPGDYFVHFRIKGEKVSSQDNYFVIDVNDYLPPSGSILASKTLTFEDVYDDFPEWRVFTLLVPNIKAGHTIETRVKLLSDHTLTVDYVKLEPAGAFVNYPFYFKIDTEHINDFAITDSKIGSFQIKSHHIGNFQIKNVHIDTLQITYDRLVKPPIGWNEVLNPSFEYGMWEQWTGADVSFARVKDEDAHSGEYAAKIAYRVDVPSPKFGNVSEWILLNPSESTLVVSSWIKATLEAGYACSWIRFFDSNKNEISCIDFNTIHGPYDTNEWRLDYVTVSIPANAKYARVGIWANTLVKATIYFDDIALVYGDQYTGFIDTTVARNRWLPDTYYSKEEDSFRKSFNAGEEIYCLTLPVTIDYHAKALIWVGVECYAKYFIYSNDYEIAAGLVRIYLDGQEIGERMYWIPIANPTNSDEWFEFIEPVAFAEEATLTPGEHTFKVSLTTPSGITPQTIGYDDRYIRVLLGSYYV